MPGPDTQHGKKKRSPSPEPEEEGSEDEDSDDDPVRKKRLRDLFPDPTDGSLDSVRRALIRNHGWSVERACAMTELDANLAVLCRMLIWQSCAGC